MFDIKFENVERNQELRVEEAEANVRPEAGGADWGLAHLAAAHIVPLTLTTLAGTFTVTVKGHAPEGDDTEKAFLDVRIEAV